MNETASESHATTPADRSPRHESPDTGFFAHPHALVESDQIGDGSRIWAFAHIMDGAIVGSHVNVGGHAFVESGAVIGDDVTIKNQVLIWEGITIEDEVFIGPRVTFTNDRYPRSPRMSGTQTRYRSKDDWLMRTRVCRGASIGAGATIAPGCTLGTSCMVGAAAMVTSDVRPFALVVGNPARQIDDVCRCGQRLFGRYDITDCSQCGQSGADRLSLLAVHSPPTTSRPSF